MIHPIPRAFYNDIETNDWLFELISSVHIMSGAVSCASISDLTASDLAGYTRVHLFAGIGGWDLALRMAEWPDDVPVWTGSCPCQPFSSAGKQQGTKDERHLWPEMRRLIATGKPAIVFGEQVASKAGRDWISEARFDLEHIIYWEEYYQNMHRLRRAKTNIEVSEILGEVIGRVETSLCGLPKRLRGEVEGKEQGTFKYCETEKAREGQELSVSLHRKRPGKISGFTWNVEEMPEKESSIRSYGTSGRDKSKNLEGCLRDDRITSEVRSRSEGLEQSIHRSDRPESWVHILQYPHSLLRGQCGSWGLGGRSATEDCYRLFGKEQIDDERTIADKFRAAVAASIVRIKLAGVRGSSQSSNTPPGHKSQMPPSKEARFGNTFSSCKLFSLSKRIF